MRKVRFNLEEKHFANIRWILMHIFIFEYSFSYGLQRVLSNSDEEKRKNLHSATQKRRYPLQLLVWLAIKCSL